MEERNEMKLTSQQLLSDVAKAFLPFIDIEMIAYLKRQWCKLFKIEHIIITNSNNEISFALRNVGKYLEGSIVVEQRQREYSIFASIIITDARDVRLRENQCGASRWILFDSRYITVESKGKSSIN